MISALYNGISGLDSFQKALNVQSNNISNVNTIGYKSDKLSFVDLMYQDRIGKGAATAQVEKNFTQGSFKITDNSYDVAIDGVGYFVIYDPANEETYYSRAGDFKQAVDGKLVTATGLNVQGHAATVTGDMIINEDYPNFMASQTVETPTSVQSINAKASDYNSSATNDVDAVTGRVTKTSSAKISDIEQLKADYREKLAAYASNPTNAGTAPVNQVTQITFGDYATQLVDENDAVTLYVNNIKYTQQFDTDAATTMQLLAEKLSSTQGIKDATFDDATGELTINTLVPGKNISIYTPAINGQEYFTVNQTAGVAGSGEAALTASLTALETALASADAELKVVTTNIAIPPKGTVDTSVVMDINALEDLQLNLTQLGISDNQFSDAEIVNGIIYMVQGDNKYAVGKIPTVAFKNESSLTPQGGRMFSTTRESGEPINAAYGSKIVSGALELSNSNMSESLVDLMTFQRAYEANSKSITTSDEFLSIAIQLKK